MAHDVADQSPTARQVLPHVRVILLLCRIIHKIFDLLDWAPGARVPDLHTALITVAPVAELRRLGQEVQQNLLVRRCGFVLLQARVCVVDDKRRTCPCGPR